ncbi:hypothetical protein ACIOEZ_07390 [Streptomyces sp. NPDC087866]|nr:hypothetical protein [Streptomyces sp. NBC_01789]MCX4444927.1 hypothetical protein [Streptomyces sp. NBC_01789]
MPPSSRPASARGAPATTSSTAIAAAATNTAVRMPSAVADRSASPVWS